MFTELILMIIVKNEWVEINARNIRFQLSSERSRCILKKKSIAFFKESFSSNVMNYFDIRR